MRSLLGWIIFLLIVTNELSKLRDESAAGARPAAQEPSSAEREQDARYRGATALLSADLERRGPAPGAIRLTANGKQLDNQGLRKLLGREANSSAFYVYKLFGVEAASASAQGLDRQHHFVNAYLEGYRPFAADNVLVPLSVLARKKDYMLDKLNHGGEEVWQTSRQAYWFTRGDCEDHAIALADWLIDMGEDARVALGSYKGGGHAWVVLIKDGREYILEATRKNGLSGLKRYPLASLQPDYQPQYQFNRSRFWHNAGSPATTDYRGGHWQEKSHFAFIGGS